MTRICVAILIVLTWTQNSKTTGQDIDRPSPNRGPVVLTEAAKKLHASCLVFDGHNDLPWQYRARDMPSFDLLDITKPQPELHTDIPRIRTGGLGAQFWSVFVPFSTSQEGKSLLMTLEQIDLVHRMIDRYPDTFELALTADDVERIHRAGKVASLIGMEGGHSIENSINALRQLYQRGARYMTLTHSSNLDWADSATDGKNVGGLTAFGEEVVHEMNRLGMLVDISHVSPDTMKHALRITKAPVIFSHSSARAIADHPRNVPDDVLRLTAENGGVVMVNFYPSFVVPSSARRSVERMVLQKRLEAETTDEHARKKQLTDWENSHPRDRGSIHDVIDHIDHIVKIAGVDHVGLGSDYDGIDAVPRQLEDVGTYPLITQELLNRGYSPEDIRRILGLNCLRVLRMAQQVAAESSP
jgi:membrane dipeptidase